MSKFSSKLKSLFSKSDSHDTFIGLIDEDGAVKGSFKDECSMTFSFIAYTKNGGEVMEEEAIIHKEVPSIDYPIKGLDALTIVKISGEQVSYHGQNRINLNSVIKSNVNHKGLTEILANRLKPVTYSSSKFGTFTLDRRANWFEQKFTWNEDKIDLCLSCDMSEIEEFEKVAIEIWNNQAEWEEKLKSKISTELLELKNKSWLDEHESPITEREFLSRIFLENITIHKKGEFEAWYNDGDTFWGHAINVSAHVNGTIGGCGIHG